MTESLRALLSGVIDYAGMFPPAGLSVEKALATYRRHREGPESWMLGRFVCPQGQVHELPLVFSSNRDGRTAIAVPGNFSLAMFPTVIMGALGSVRGLGIVKIIDTIEFRWPDGLVKSADLGVLETVMRMAAQEGASLKLPRVTLYFEIPRMHGGRPAAEWQRIVLEYVGVLGDYYQYASPAYGSAGIKIRCGGDGAGAIPPLAEVATVICACRDAEVFWKATAGLHHPFRHADSALGVPVHGFINLLTAAVMADAHRLDVEQVQCILEDDDPWHFRFTNEALTWRELSATVPQIAGARERALRSFGSCSIDEPWQDLTVLGLI